MAAVRNVQYGFGKDLGKRSDDSKTERKAEKVKEMVLARAADAGGIAHEASGEEWTVNPNGTWPASAMSTHIGPRGPVTSAVIQQPLVSVVDRPAGMHPMHLEWLPFPNDICKEAFNKIMDNMCVVRQMVEALKGYELAEIQDQMDDVQNVCNPSPKRDPFERKSWRNFGVTQRMLLEWCKQRKHP